MLQKRLSGGLRVCELLRWNRRCSASTLLWMGFCLAVDYGYIGILTRFYLFSLPHILVIWMCCCSEQFMYYKQIKRTSQTFTTNIQFLILFLSKLFINPVSSNTKIQKLFHSEILLVNTTYAWCHQIIQDRKCNFIAGFFGKNEFSSHLCFHSNEFSFLARSQVHAFLSISLEI